MEAVQSLIGALPYMGDDDFDHPFLAPSLQAESSKPDGSMRQWLLTVSVEANVLYSSFSTYFGAPEQGELIQSWLNLGIDSPLLRQRLQLLRRKNHL